MKKIFLALVLVMCLASLSSAQMLGKGVKVGLNMANLSGDDVEDAKMKMGIAGGAYLTYGINDMFAVQPEVLFSMKGAKYDVEGDPSYSLNYIDIPVLFKVNAGMEGPAKPFFLLGPSIGILMSADYDGTDIKDYMKTTDFGLVFGAGVDTQMGFSVDARWGMGMGTIMDVEGDPDVKNSVISLMVGYGF